MHSIGYADPCDAGSKAALSGTAVLGRMVPTPQATGDPREEDHEDTTYRRRGALLALVGVLAFGQPARAATGFTVADGKLYDAGGNQFIMRGVNHAHTWYAQQTNSFADIKALGANTVRVVLSSGDRWTRNSNADVANVISLCKANRLICMLEVHDTTGYGEQSGAITLDRAADYWVSLADVLAGQEKYVIVNTATSRTATRATPPGPSTRPTHQATAHGGLTTRSWWTPRTGVRLVLPHARQRRLGLRRRPGTATPSAPSTCTRSSTPPPRSRFTWAGSARRAAIVVGEFGFDHSDGNPDEDAILSTPGQRDRLAGLVVERQRRWGRNRTW